MTAASPSCAAAHAVAAPWFPVDAVTTPGAPAALYAASAGSAPRHLNAPSSCVSSRLRYRVRPCAMVVGAGSKGVMCMAASQECVDVGRGCRQSLGDVGPADVGDEQRLDPARCDPDVVRSRSNEN